MQTQTPEEAEETIAADLVDGNADPEVVERALARVEKDVLTTAHLQARAHAAAMLARMPEWWKEKLRVVAKTHFACRKGRRATAKVLRDFASWERRNARTRALQAAAKESRRLHVADGLR